MRYSDSKEHYVTLFDSNFLPIGMCLHASLLEYGKPFHLWILCIDELVERQLSKIDLPHVSLIPLREVETHALKEVKKTRTRGEYCWTLTSFTPQFVFDRTTNVERVTYIDSDLYFFDSPHVLLDEFEESGKDVLITEHAYAPEYDKSATSGKFCVQFITFRNNSGGIKVMRWWQKRCLEWCFARAEDGKFGDQKYLDTWPEIFANEVHVFEQVEKTLAPWNLTRFVRDAANLPECVFFHFHSLRILSPVKVILYLDYRLNGLDQQIYENYLVGLKQSIDKMHQYGMDIPVMPLRGRYLARMLRLARSRLRGTIRTASIG